MRRALGLVDPAGAVQARQFTSVKIRPVLCRINLQSRLGERRQRQIHCPVGHGVGIERPCDKGQEDDAENRRREADGDKAAADIASFVRSWRKVVLVHCAYASTRVQIRLDNREASTDVQAMASKTESESSAISPKLASAAGATSQN
jgi:hypothetical protein